MGVSGIVYIKKPTATYTYYQEEKRMSFFNNVAVKVIAWILLVLSTVVLIIGGVSQAEFVSVIAAVVGIVAAVSELIILIGNLVKKKSE